MSSPPPPSRGFHLPKLAWVGAAVCAFAPLAGMVKRAIAGELSLYGLTAGLLIAGTFMLVPAAVAWLAWRLGGRRESVRDSAFWGALAALFVGAIFYAVHTARARETALSVEARALATDLVDGAGPASPGGSTSSQPIGEARRAVKARLDAAQLAYELAAEPVTGASFFELRPLADPEAIAQRRAQVEGFLRANNLLHEAASLGAFYFSSELRDRQVPESAVREAVAVYRGATKKHLPRLERLRDTDRALAMLMTQFLDFAEAQRGRWRVDPASSAIVFDASEAGQRHDELRRTAEVLHAERETLRATLRTPAR